jgi:cell division septation protein DedD
MADQNIREIQVSGKQLVFLFMASVVVAVAIFLLGVSVGRGVHQATAGEPVGAAMASAADTAPPADAMPPATKLTDQDQTFAKNLQQGGAAQPSASAASTPAAAAPATTETPEVSEPEANAPAATATSNAARSTAVPPPAAPKAAEPAPAPKTSLPAPSASGWALQVNAFRSRENADKEVAQLKAKGYPAFVVPGQAGGLFRVRVGPYAQRADADRVAARMRQEGLKPSVTR